jgi:hypothetical protein
LRACGSSLLSGARHSVKDLTFKAQAASGFYRKSRLYFGIPSKKARELLTDPFVIFYSIDSFACASPHWSEYFLD